MKTQRIHISIAFGDAILPVIHCEDGHQRVPLKPIVEQVGAQWAGQRRKLENSEYLSRRLGAKIETLKCPGRPQLCIRIDRVTTFLNTINPENVRSNGNTDTADWLEAKHAEWDDALHAYETNGFATKPGSAAGNTIRLIAQIDRIKNPALKQIAAQQANEELGLDIPIARQKPLELPGGEG